MIRRPIALLLFVALGLWSSLAAQGLYLCLGGGQCGTSEAAPCDRDSAPAGGGCCDDDEDCCVALGGVPDATEALVPPLLAPVAAPVALRLPVDAATLPPLLSRTEGAPRPPRAPPRIRFGVWRL